MKRWLLDPVESVLGPPVDESEQTMTPLFCPNLSRPPTPFSHRWLAIIVREGKVQVCGFWSEAFARRWFETWSVQWSESYFCAVVKDQSSRDPVKKPAPLYLPQAKGPRNMSEYRWFVVRVNHEEIHLHGFWDYDDARRWFSLTHDRASKTYICAVVVGPRN